jgi:hypothetical protein
LTRLERELLELCSMAGEPTTVSLERQASGRLRLTGWCRAATASEEHKVDRVSAEPNHAQRGTEPGKPAAAMTVQGERSHQHEKADAPQRNREPAQCGVLILLPAE